MNERFEFEGKVFEIDYGIDYIPKEGEKKQYMDYAGFVALLNPHIKWIDGSEDDYQGEWWAVGKDKEGNYYLHQGSFGSCSGCDWLQGIDTVDGGIEFLKAMKKVTPLGSDVEKVKSELLKSANNAWSDGKEVIKKLIGRLHELDA